MQDAGDLALDEQGDAEQAADALLAQDRVEDVGVVDVLDDHRALVGGDAAGEAAAERDAGRPARPPPRCPWPRGRRARRRPRRAAGTPRCRRAGSRRSGPAARPAARPAAGRRARRPSRAGRAAERARRRALLLERAGVLDAQRRAVGDELEEVAVGVGEPARGEGADVQDAGDLALDEQGDAEQAADALLAQDRVVGCRRGRRPRWSRGGLSAAMRPAKPRPRGIRTPCSTSSSIPLAARATSSPASSSSSRNAAVSACRISAIRSSSSASSSSSARWASAASVTRCIGEQDVGDWPGAVTAGDDRTGLAKRRRSRRAPRRAWTARAGRAR